MTSLRLLFQSGQHFLCSSGQLVVETERVSPAFNIKHDPGDRMNGVVKHEDQHAMIIIITTTTVPGFNNLTQKLSTFFSQLL